LLGHPPSWIVILKPQQRLKDLSVAIGQRRDPSGFALRMAAYLGTVL